MTLGKHIICGLALAAAATAPIYAKVVTDATRATNFIWSGTTPTLVPLNGGGALSISFSGKGRHVISYSAECETTGSWVSIEILVDGVVLAPTAGTADAFCSDHRTAESLDAWTTAHYTVATPALGGGVHTVQIRGTVVPNGGASEQGWLGDTSLVIEK